MATFSRCLLCANKQNPPARVPPAPGHPYKQLQTHSEVLLPLLVSTVPPEEVWREGRVGRQGMALTPRFYLQGAPLGQPFNLSRPQFTPL